MKIAYFMCMKILGIETSCDETSAAVLSDGKVLSNIISSQMIHQKFGGVVPELASRAHQRMMIPVVEQALQVANSNLNEINGIAVTYGPGLVGALMVGLNFAKALAFQLNIPFVGVNHMHAHLYSNFLSNDKPDYPFICLIVSGGHTQLVYVTKPLEHKLLGETLDDAAGEAYDKVAKMLGLGFPGGPFIDKLASEGDPNYVKFPRAYLDKEEFSFSFSGIKTSVLYWLKKRNYYSESFTKEIPETELKNLCASFQAAVIDVLVEKTFLAAEKYKVNYIAVSGGVSANSELRKRLLNLGKEKNIRVFIPALEYCTDNAAMTALVGEMLLERKIKSPFTLNAKANLSIEEF